MCLTQDVSTGFCIMLLLRHSWNWTDISSSTLLVFRREGVCLGFWRKKKVNSYHLVFFCGLNCKDLRGISSDQSMDPVWSILISFYYFNKAACWPSVQNVNHSGAPVRQTCILLVFLTACFGNWKYKMEETGLRDLQDPPPQPASQS